MCVAEMKCPLLRYLFCSCYVFNVKSQWKIWHFLDCFPWIFYVTREYFSYCLPSQIFPLGDTNTCCGSLLLKFFLQNIWCLTDSIFHLFNSVCSNKNDYFIISLKAPMILCLLMAFALSIHGILLFSLNVLNFHTEVDHLLISYLYENWM